LRKVSQKALIRNVASNTAVESGRSVESIERDLRSARERGRLGGEARARKMTVKERSDAAARAARLRWFKRFVIT
jgi:hypothetical protein